MSENNNSKSWIVLGLLVIGIIFGVGPFKNTKCTSDKGDYDASVSSSPQTGSDPSFIGGVSAGEYCNGDGYSCHCPGYERYSSADWHCKNCGHVKSDHKFK